MIAAVCSHDIPCVMITGGWTPPPELVAAAAQHSIPLLRTTVATPIAIARIGAVLDTLAFIVGVQVESASATAPSGTDLTDGAGDTFFSTITSYFTSDVLPAVLVLLALMVGVGVLIKLGKRAAKSS